MAPLSGGYLNTVVKSKVKSLQDKTQAGECLRRVGYVFASTRSCRIRDSSKSREF